MGKVQHFIAGKINYFDWAMASIVNVSLPEGTLSYNIYIWAFKNEQLGFFIDIYLG
jgi:hypothetical protein